MIDVAWEACTTPELAAEPSPRRTGGLGRYLAGQILLAVCLAAAGMLAAEHLSGLRLPGCGPSSGCAQLAAGRWGSIHGWPVSFLGAAWFAALAAFFAWTGRWEPLPWLLRFGVRAARSARCGSSA